MDEKRFERKNKFSKCLLKIEFLKKNQGFLEFLKTSVPHFGYPGFQNKNRFCNKLIFTNKVKVNVQPLSPPTPFLITTKFMGNHILTHVSTAILEI